MSGAVRASGSYGETSLFVYPDGSAFWKTYDEYGAANRIPLSRLELWWHRRIIRQALARQVGS